MEWGLEDKGAKWNMGMLLLHAATVKYKKKEK
jgi:hypothetical protein